jgi:hypothetical protein
MHESPVFRVIIIKKVIYTYLKKKIIHKRQRREREGKQERKKERER